MYVNTGLSGNGFVSLLPLDTTFCSVYGSDPALAYSGNVSNGYNTGCIYYIESDARYIP